MNWKNKRVMLTGGSSGIGAQLLADLKQKGAQIASGGLEKDKVAQMVSLHKVKGITADLTREEELLSFFEQAVDHLGGIDILINNAGYVIAEPFEKLKREDFEKMFAINSIAPARLSQLAIPYFKAQGHGDIVNIGATGGQYAFPTGTAYSASKAALTIISKNLSLEFRKDNIRVFHLDPSWVADTNNYNYGTPIPKDEEKLNPPDISQLIIGVLELNRRAFVPQMSIWGTKP